MLLEQRQYQNDQLTPKGERGVINWIKTSPVAHVGGGALLAVLVLRWVK